MKFKVIDNKTGKEADVYDIALHEYADRLCYCDMEGFAITEDGNLVLMDECGQVVYCETERFKVVIEDERPHGEWKLTDNRWGVGTWRCTNCDSYYDVDTNYCPTCGADMRKEGDA